MAIPVRAAATQVIGQLLRQQGSLSSLLPTIHSKVDDGDRPLLQELCFGTLRYYPKLSHYVTALVDKPLRSKDSDVQALLLLGLYQLLYTRIPDHAAIAETVEVTRLINKPWATKLVNGVLRRFQREREHLDTLLVDNMAFTTNHPIWLVNTLAKHYPALQANILAANDAHPPFTLRINTRKVSREEYLSLLADLDIDAQPTVYSPYGVTLSKPCDPRTLPLFNEGVISIQDEAAQFSADLLQLSPNLRVLDACAAPGGKTGHMLEREPSLEVVALDAEERRLTRVRENLARLGVTATIMTGDASQPEAWWDGQLFDRILLDAPCSATGILRRHPDIKALRTPEDIDRLSQLQGCILAALWKVLAPGGVLVYATCSIMPKENTKVIEAFLAEEPSARLDVLDVPWGIAAKAGRQLLPTMNGHDGFYYARLIKVNNDQ